MTVIAAERVYLSFREGDSYDQARVFAMLDVAMRDAEVRLGYQVDEDEIAWTHRLPGRMPDERMWYLAPKSRFSDEGRGMVIQVTRMLRDPGA